MEIKVEQVAHFQPPKKLGVHDKCVLCDQEDENPDHLFLKSTDSKELWSCFTEAGANGL